MYSFEGDHRRSQEEHEGRYRFEGLDNLSPEGLGACQKIELAEIMTDLENQYNPETAVIRRDLMRHMSDEAVQFLDVLVDVPAELVERVNSKHTHLHVTSKDVSHYLGWTWYRQKRVTDELRELLLNLGTEGGA